MWRRQPRKSAPPAIRKRPREFVGLNPDGHSLNVLMEGLRVPAKLSYAAGQKLARNGRDQVFVVRIPVLNPEYDGHGHC